VLIDRPQPSPMHDQCLREHLDWLRCGMVFCNAEARVHWLNGSAQRLLAAGPLRLVGSRLLCDSEADFATLMKALEKSVAAGGNTVRYLRLGWAESALHVAIMAAAQPCTLVLTLTSPTRGVDLPTEALTQLFGLTPAEAALVAALAAGSTLEQHARKRGVAVATVRVQLKHVNMKTGVRRQSDLVRLVWSSAAGLLVGQ
jgi:DNA-binding CsgD family transcriptional regulator